tara:strand:+ start:538 stop:990 length:453 start_codon:yes stop_codon:yes gene_type:complete
MITEAIAIATAVILTVQGVGRMPLSPQEKRAANSIAEARGFRESQTITLGQIRDHCNIEGESVAEAIRDIGRIMSASKQAILSLREENDALRAAINAQGRLETIAMLKRMTVSERFRWESINYHCPVDTHPDIDLNSAGQIVDTKTRRYL